MIYQPRAWGHWIQQNPLEEFIIGYCGIILLIASHLFAKRPPGAPVAADPCKYLRKQLDAADRALDALRVPKYDRTGIEMSAALRITSMEPHYRTGPVRRMPAKA